MPWRVFVRRALNQLADSQRLSDSALLRRAAQLAVYQWTKVAERAGRMGLFATSGEIGARWLEVKGHGRLVRMSRNFANNWKEEMKRIGGGGRGNP